MDNSRNADLAVLNRRMNDSNLSLTSRKIAAQSYHKILAQMCDKTLTELRHSLIRAKAANDDRAADQIELQIKEYSWRHNLM